MGSEKRVKWIQKSNKNNQAWIVTSHAFNDLTHVLPLVFLYLLKECYFRGTCKVAKRFRIFQQHIHQVLYNSPKPGPAIYVAHCLYIIPTIFEHNCEGFCHLIISSLDRYLKTETTKEDLAAAKDFTAQLVLNIISGKKIQDESLLVKILEVYKINLTDIEKAADSSKNSNLVKYFVEKYIKDLIDSKSYTKAVALLEHFDIHNYGESFLFEILENKDYKAAEKWSMFMGKPYLCELVKEYVNKGLFKNAYGVIKENDLGGEFPEVYYKYKESSLKKLAEKGCWDIAEERANSNRQLLEFLVYLAMEAGYPEKVNELCDRYSLEGFMNAGEPEANLLRHRYLQFGEMGLEGIIWVDDVDSLQDATCHIEECKVVGLDCEWKPNYMKGGTPNKVSIMQLASEKRAYIFDLIKLYEEVPDALDSCLTRILHSPRVLKLGYNFQCDVNQLSHSYLELQCFKHYEMLLDIQNVYKESRGGLSGLAEKVLGTGLNKTRRNCNWELRPLSPDQLEYAALDAAVLIHIFRHVRGLSANNVSDGQTKIEWKSCMVSHMDKPKKTKKVKTSKKKKKIKGWETPNLGF